MSLHNLRIVLVCATALTLAACGGGGGGDSHVNSTPTPPPPPPPPPSASPAIFPNVTSSTQFAALGIELSGKLAAPFTKDGFAVRYDAASNQYIFDLPTTPSGAFVATSDSDTAWSGGLKVAGQTILWPPMSVLKASSANPEMQFSYTNYAAYLQAGPMEDLPRGFVAFGLATPQGAVPVTGSATYDALVAGNSFDQFGTITGAATLQFDFGAGQLSGHFDPIYWAYTGGSTALGRYDFVNTVFGVGSPMFSGQLSNSSFGQNGTFDGLFTGPQAQELMARWTAPFHDPSTNTDSQMFGVWVGKKN